MKLQPHPVSLRQLQYVVAVAEQKSFRKAAAACAVSQPSLSAQIALVEEQIGVKLFERDKRHVALTDAGAVVVARARALCVAADDFVDAARAFADPFAGELKLGVIPTLAPYLLPEVAPLLRKRMTRLRLLWIEEKTPFLKKSLDDAGLDAAIVALDADFAALPHVVIGKDPFVFAAPPTHPLIKQKQRIRPEDLAGETVLLLDDGHCFRDQALAVCARAGADEAGLRATSLQTLVQMAAAGAGVTLLPRIAVSVENRHSPLAIRPFIKEPSRTLALVWRKASTRTLALEAVGAVMREGYAKKFAD